MRDGEEVTKRGDASELDHSTLEGGRTIFRRFIIVALGLNALVGAAMVVYDVTDSLLTTDEWLKDNAQLLARICQRLQRGDPTRPAREVVSRASELTGAPMALLDRQGQLHYASKPTIAGALPRVYPDGVRTGARVAVRRELGELSGAWLVVPLADDRRLLVIYPHSVDTEGIFLYMTISAALMGLGLAFSVLLMLLSARWIVHRPLRALVDRLTGALARDNERRRAAEQAAVKARTEAEHHLAFRDNLINASNWVCIVATDLEDRIQIFSRGAEALLGYRADETVGQMTLEDLRHKTQRVPSQEVPLRSLLQPGEGEEFFVDNHGKEHLVLLNESEITDADGQRVGRLLVFVDVTRRKRLEAELQLNELQLIQSAKMASLGEMATGVAHELNQPLNNIGILISRVIRKLARPEGCDADFLRERLTKVESQIQRASKIIDQLRTFGHPRGPQVTPTSLRQPVENVLDLMRQQLADRAIGLRLDLPDDLPHVMVDAAQLEQVLINLLNNARDALAGAQIPERQITIRARPSRLAGKPAVVLHVMDNGPGMAAAVRERVFQPFFTTKEAGKGTGLGLSISYSLVQGFGGKLALQSAEGKGADFTVTLPAVAAEEDEELTASND